MQLFGDGTSSLDGPKDCMPQLIVHVLHDGGVSHTSPRAANAGSDQDRYGQAVVDAFLEP